MSETASFQVADSHVLSTTGSTRGTAYTLSNKIVSWGGRTHVSWLDKIAEVKVATYDRNSGEWLGTWHVGTGLDNHGGPALVADSRGYLHIVFGPHHGDFQQFRSVRPNDASEWVDMGLFGARGTYPSLVCDSEDTLHCAYRGLGSPWQAAYQNRPAGGEWSEPVALVDAAVPDGYTQYTNALAVGRDDSIHLAFHVYDLHPAGGKAVGYLKSTDGGETWGLADGTAVELPFTPEMPGMIEQDPGFDMRAGNVALSPAGLPYFTVTHGERGDEKPHSTLLWRWTGSEWASADLTERVRRLMPGAHGRHGTLCFDDRGGLWVTVECSLNGGWGDPTARVFVLYSPDRGVNFEALQVSEPDTTASNWFPSIERSTGHNRVGIPHLVYTIGEAGETCTDPIDTEIRFVTLERP